MCLFYGIPLKIFFSFKKTENKKKISSADNLHLHQLLIFLKENL